MLGLKKRPAAEQAPPEAEPPKKRYRVKRKRTRAYVGFDFIGNEVRIVQVARKGKQLALERITVAPLEKEVFRAGRVADITAFRETLGKLLEEARITGTIAGVALSGVNSVVRVFSLPKLTRSQLRETIDSQLSQFVPFPPEDTVYQYQILEEYEEDESPMYEILLMATRYSALVPIVRGLQGLGFSVISIKVGLAGAMSVLRKYYEDYAQSVALVDVRERYSDVAFISENQFRLSRTIELGTDAILSRIATMLGITKGELERQIWENEVDLLADPASVPPEQVRVLEAFKTAFQTFGNELVRSVRYFEGKSRKKVRVGRIVILGKIRGLANLDGFLSELTAVDTVIADPLENIDYSMAEWYPPDRRAHMAEIVNALGIAVNAMTPKERRFMNLLPREFLVRTRVQNIAIGAVGLVAIISLWGVTQSRSLDMKIAAEEAKLEEWKAKNAEVAPDAQKFDETMDQIGQLAPKLRAVALLFGSQFPWPLLLEEIRTLMPQKVWLGQAAAGGNENVGLDLTNVLNNGQIEIKGQSLGLEPIFQFAKRIYESNYFGEVEVEFELVTSGGAPAGGGAVGGAVGGRAGGRGGRGAPTKGVGRDLVSLFFYFQELPPLQLLFNFTMKFSIDKKYIRPEELI